MEGFNQKTKLQIRFGDTDALGHVNNAFYLSYVELARLEYFDNVLKDKVDWTKEGIILARAEIDYRQMLFLHDEAYVYIRTSRMGNKSFDLEYVIVAIRDGEEKVITTAKTVMVAFHYTENKAIPMLPEWIEAIEEFEGVKF